MTRAEQIQGAQRSLLIGAAILAGFSLLCLGLGSVGSLLWKLVIFPHGGFVSAGPYQHRPGHVFGFGAACLLAILQWASVLLGLAWFTRAQSARRQFLISLLTCFAVSVLVILGSFLWGQGIEVN
jgi:hypothetical protein